MEKKPKVLVIVGPTASGKSALGVKLAKKFKGEIISADSRQVYRGLNIGSGKVTKKEMAGIPHHLLDVTNLKRTFTVSQYQKLAYKKVKEILKHGKLPIIVGGTGFYIQAVVDGLILPAVPPNPKLRQSLKNKSTEELFARIRELDPARARTIDRQNPHRLIRAIEIATALGQVPKVVKSPPPYNFLQLGVMTPTAKLRERIHNRLLARMRTGLVAEVARLHRGGLSWQRLENFGLEYKFVASYLQKKLTKAEMLEKLEQAINQYAKRQMTWFGRDKRIRWRYLKTTASPLNAKRLKRR